MWGVEVPIKYSLAHIYAQHQLSNQTPRQELDSFSVAVQSDSRWVSVETLTNLKISTTVFSISIWGTRKALIVCVYVTSGSLECQTI